MAEQLDILLPVYFLVLLAFESSFPRASSTRTCRCSVQWLARNLAMVVERVRVSSPARSSYRDVQWCQLLRILGYVYITGPRFFSLFVLYLLLHAFCCYFSVVLGLLLS